MEQHSMVRSVLRYWEKSQLRQPVRRRPQLEALESREVLSATILSVSPLDGTILSTNSTSITITYSEDVIGADNVDNYILRDSSGQRVPLSAVSYNPITFQATFTVADINNGAPLPLDTYTLFVRGDQILDADDLTPLAQPSRVVASNSLLRTVNVVDVLNTGGLASPGNLPLPAQGSRQAQPYALASGDLNGDGIDDLVVVNGGIDTVNIYYGRSASQGVGFSTQPDLTLLLPIGALNPIKDVQIADFNNDGKNDIVVMNNFFDTITVFTNISEGTGAAAFSAPNTFFGIIDPREMAVADFDGDGFKDIAVVNAQPFILTYEVTIFQNDQNTLANNFLPPANFTVGNLISGVREPVSLALGDFNNDGKVDIVVAGQGLRILFNNSTPGNLAFTAGPLLSNSTFTSVAALRVDGNTSVDIVAVRDDGNLVTFLNLNTPTPSFVQRVTPTTPATGGRLKVGDLNGDGRDELVVTGGTGSNTASVISTTTRFGAANFLTVSGVVQVQSFNHGLVSGDRVVISGVTGQTGLNGSFTITVLDANRFTLNAYVGDGTAATPGVWALTGTISGASNTPGSPIVITSTNHRLTDGTRVTVSAVGGNTAANGTWTVRVLTPNTFELVGSVPSGNYTSGGSWVVAGPVGITATATTQNGPIGLTFLDANQDGNLDVATANVQGNSVTILPGDGQRGFLTPEELDLTQANTTAVAYADLNGDGIPDIVAISSNAANAASRVSVMLGNADGTFQNAFDYAPDTSTTFSRLSSVIVADVTGDGKPDIIVTGRGTPGNDGVAILRNNITTPTLQANSFLLGASLNTGDAPTGVVAGDFDGDGIVDLAVSHNLPGGVANSTRRGVTFLRGTGSGNFAPGVQVAAAQGFAAAGLVALDYNDDGNLDLAVVDNNTPGQVLLLRGLGTGQFRSAGLFETGLSQPTAIVAGDVNNDGRPDLIVSSGSTGQTTGGISVLLNDNGTTFREGIRSAVQPGVALNNLAVGDLNADGLLDVVVGARYSGGSAINNLYVLYGIGDGSFTPAAGYLSGETPSGTSNTFIALGETPLLRLTTFQTGGTQVITNLVKNPGFEEAALGGQQGNLTGWQTFKLLTGPNGGSAGGYGPQSGFRSPLSGVGVLPPVGRFQAMLDQPDQQPFLPGETNPNPASSYAGTHALYQDILIPANATTAFLSLRLYLQSDGAWSDPLSNPSLNHTTLLPNQQVRVDIVRPSAGILSIAPADVLLNVFRTASGEPTTQVVDLSNINLSAFAGQTIRLRIGSANNQGKLIVGVEDVRLIATFNDTVAPTVSQLRLRTPATNPSGFPLTTDPTVLGRVTDNAGLKNIAYVEFDPRNAGFQPGTTLRTSQFDALGNFAFSFANLPLGRYSVAVRAVDKAGNVSAVSIIRFEYQNLLNNDWQALGPTGIRLSDPNLDYSAVSGRITAIDTDPSDPSGNTYYVGSVNGGVWKTTDGGTSWQPLMNNLVVAGQRIVPAIGALAVAPSRPQTVYAGLGVADLLPDSRAGSGILRSINGGQTWAIVGNSATVFANARISKIVVDPNNADIVYVGVASGGQSGPGVYKSTNGGRTWTNVMTPSVMTLAGGGTASGPLASVTDLIIDRFDGTRLLVGLGNVGLTGAASDTAGLWLSTNGGLSWSQQLGGDNPDVPNNTLPSGVDVGVVKVAQGQGRSGDQRFVYVFIGTPTGDNTPPNRDLGGFQGLYRSSDNLANFTRVMLRQDADPTAGFDFQDISFGNETSYAAALAVDPTNPNVVFVGGSRKLSPNNALVHSLVRVDTGNMLDASNSLLNNGNDALKGASGADEGVYWYDIEQAVSGGISANRLLPPTITRLRFDAQGRLLIGTDGGLWSGTSLGFGYDYSSGGTGLLRNSPGPIAGMRLTPINGNLQIASVTSAAADPSQPGRTYASTIASGQAVTDRPLGFVSQDLSRSPTGTFDAGVIRAGARDTTNPDTPAALYRVWKYDTTGVLRPEISTDGGNTWTTITTNISITGSEAGYFPVLEVNPRKVNTGGNLFDEVLFGTNRVYGTRSTVWDAISPVFSATGHITALGIAPVSATGFYYAGTSEGQLWVAPTGGGTSAGDWINRSTGLPNGLPITGITVAASNPNVAFVSVGDRVTGARIFRTNNAGRTWINTTANLPAGRVHDILFDNRAALNAPGGKIYAATDAGVFVLVAGSSTWFRVGNLPSGPVVDLSLDPTNNILSASVQGRGVFNLSVAGISPIADQFTDEDTVLGPIRFTLNALGVPNPVLNVSATSSNPAVVSNSGILLGGAGAVRTLTIRPVANASGQTTITLRVNDGVRVFATSFVLTVEAVNDVPTISPIADVSLSLNQPSNTIPFTIADVEDPATALTVTATSDNQTLIPNSAIVLSGSGANRFIQFTPAVNTAGTARITISVSDTQGGVGIRTFDVVVQDTTALPYSDDFNRPNNNFLGAVWTSPVGNFAVENNAAQSTTRLALAVLSGPVEQNVTVSADIALPLRSGQFAALVARYSGVGDRNMYIGGIQATTAGTFNALIFRNLNGVWTQLASRPIPTGTGNLSFQVVDSSLKLYLDGSLVLFAFDNALTAGGSVGLRSGGAVGIRYDNFDAQVVLDVPPAPPYSDDFSAPVNGQLDPSIWRERAGNFRIMGGMAQSAATGASTALLNPTFVSTTDATLEVDFSLGTGAFAGLIARSDDAGRNFYQAGLVRTSSGLRAAIYRVVNGVGTLLASTAVTSSSGRLKFTLSGTTLELDLDGNNLLSISDSVLTSAGTVGLRTSGAAQFDNFFFNV